MKKSLENVHVVIYSKKMLKEIKGHLENLGYQFEASFKADWLSDNYRLRFKNGLIGLNHVPSVGSVEVTLNEFVEIAFKTMYTDTKVESGAIVSSRLISMCVDICDEREYAQKGVKLDKFADLKKALMNGAIIERNTQTGWVIDVYPQWDHSTEYRIKPEPKVNIGDYVVTELKDKSVDGFYAYRIELQESADNLNRKDTLYNFKIISKEKFEELRKDALC